MLGLFFLPQVEFLPLHKIPINKFHTVLIQVMFICAALVFQAVFQSDMGPLLEQVGTGKESLNFMKRRMRRLAAQWASAARRLDDKLRNRWREQKRVNMRLQRENKMQIERARVVVSSFQSVIFHRDEIFFKSRNLPLDVAWYKFTKEKMQGVMIKQLCAGQTDL